MIKNKAMDKSNQAIVDRFFAALGKQDLNGIRDVMAENVKWHFMGRHPYAGVKSGFQEVIDFFNTMAKLMGTAKPTIEKPIISENENHLIECVHTKANRPDGITLDHFAAVLWTFSNGKIIEGRHFFADPEAVDNYFNAVSEVERKL